MGCSNLVNQTAKQAVSETEDTNAKAEDMETQQREGFIGTKAYEENFERPHTENHIYIDTLGYDIKDQKIGYFVGEDLQTEFEVHKKETDEVVLRGNLVLMQSSNAQMEPVYKGDFSSLQETGEYYLQTAVIGQSYPFIIENNHWKSMEEKLQSQLFGEAAQEYWKVTIKARNKIALHWKGCMATIVPCCLAYRLNLDAYNKEVGKCLDGCIQWLSQTQEELAIDTISQDDLYIAVVGMTLVQELLKNDYPKDIQICDKLAVSYFEQAEKRDTQNQNTIKMGRLMAAAALYNQTGNANYHKICKDEWKQYKQQSEMNQSGNLQWDTVEFSYQKFLASYIYLACERGVDVKICEEMMSEFMKECTQYLDNSVNYAFGETDFYEEAERERAILLDAQKLAVADYIIVSREYRNVCKQQIHNVLYHNPLEELEIEQQAMLWMILRVINR